MEHLHKNHVVIFAAELLAASIYPKSKDTYPQDLESHVKKELEAFITKEKDGILQNHAVPVEPSQAPEEVTLSHPNLKGRVTRLKVESGWLYNFWDTERDDYSKEWVFVPALQPKENE